MVCAALAGQIVAHYQRGGKETLNHPDAIAILSRYGDLNLSFETAKDAWKAYQILTITPTHS